MTPSVSSPAPSARVLARAPGSLGGEGEGGVLLSGGIRGIVYVGVVPFVGIFVGNLIVYFHHRSFFFYFFFLFVFKIQGGAFLSRRLTHLKAASLAALLASPAIANLRPPRGIQGGAGVARGERCHQIARTGRV